MKKITFILACLLLCSGCAPLCMYDGYKRPSSQTAIIGAFCQGILVDSRNAKITEIDGQKVDSIALLGKPVYEVLPGIHTVKFYVSEENNRVRTNRLYYERTIDAKAGHQYRIRAVGTSNAVRVKIIDTLR